MKIFLFAGETSGDLHGEQLVFSLRNQFPLAHIYGVGGPKMRAAGLECIVPMEKFQVMGFVDVFFALPRLFKLFFHLRNTLLKEKPDIVLFIDYPGFNLALAKSLNKRKFPGKICHYICPSVWAWSKKRIPKMEHILDQLFVIFPFEKNLFNPEKLSVHYVGHPLAKRIAADISKPIDIDPKYRVVALFPGSREKELQRNFPMQLKVAKSLLKKYPDLFFVVSVAEPAFSRTLDEMMRSQGFHAHNRILFINSSQNASLMKRSTLALAKSGTNNLELALFQVPTVVTYGIGLLDLFIAKNILRIRLPHYCIVNIIAEKRIFPELIGPHLTEKSLFTYADRFLSSPKIHLECREKCREIGKILNDKLPEQEIVHELKNLYRPSEKR